ncbi:Hypothetical predicted protein [Pelobates cultripes]|uniref:Uncharacterized protein n=1 Tax=Pelobates cultripes TaxID=61616 RepID=A0AAD1QX35_PELCU|nr:Hypothetical predicted protein [Pelobates cultripes]
MADTPAPLKRDPVPRQADLIDPLSHIEERLEAAFNRFWATLMDRMKRAPPAKLPRGHPGNTPNELNMNAERIDTQTPAPKQQSPLQTPGWVELGLRDPPSS